MSAPDAVEFAGTDEELEKYLLEFARRTAGWVARDPKRGGVLVGGGSLLSTNANTVLWRIRVRREGGTLTLRSEGRSFPWTRAKVARLAGHRRGQLADYLATRLRGGGPEKFDSRHLAEPFTSFGSDVASVTASIPWSLAGAVGALAAALVAVTLLSLPLMNRTIHEVVQRADAVAKAGGLPLPPPHETASISFGFLLGCAFLFGFPIAFFAGLVHAAAVILGEIWAGAARMGQAAFLFVFVLLALALFPYFSVLALLPAFGVPLAAHAGYTLIWGRRRERLREGPPPGRRAAVVGIVLAAVLAATLTPGRASGNDFTDRLALFRDRFLLGTLPGKAAAEFYYRYTLYAAAPLKQFYSADPRIPVHSLRTAHVTPEAAAMRGPLQALDFSIVPVASIPHDVAAEELAGAGPSEELKQRLDLLARRAFRGGALREVSALGWSTLYYAGPAFLTALLVGAFCPGVSLLFRSLPRRAALGSLGGLFVLALGLLLWDASRHAHERRILAGIRTEPSPARLGPALVHSDPRIRHAAAYLAFRHPSPALAGPLLQAADDPELPVRIWAVAALGATGDSRALPVLIARLGDPELFVRYRAAEGLGFLREAGAVPALVRRMTEGGWYEGVYALHALRRIQPGRF